MWKRLPDPASSSSYSPDEEPNPTIFNWAKNRRTWIHLIAFLIFSVIIHGSGFYLFQVVYPSPTRVQPRADMISLMDPVDPNVRSLLQRIGDRMTFLLPPSEVSGIQVSVDELPVRFTPSFQITEITPANPVFAWSFPPSAGLAGSATASIDEPLDSGLRLTSQGGLLERERAPWSIMEDYLSLAEWLPTMRIEIVVDQAGLVEVKNVEGELDQQAAGEIKQVVESTLRYLPGPEESSGWLEIRRKD
ncbi:MAG: hypothetical protein P1U68_15470 [Verrucomicrobiales bacterium]|nr:hypothetical protein [Verrucomicrobiales bacterium]